MVSGGERNRSPRPAIWVQARLPNGRHKQLRTGAPFGPRVTALGQRGEAMCTGLALERDEAPAVHVSRSPRDGPRFWENSRREMEPRAEGRIPGGGHPRATGWDPLGESCGWEWGILVQWWCNP